VSKKRNKNQRKKQVRKRSNPRRDDSNPSAPSDRLESVQEQWESDYEAPEIQTPATSRGGIGRFQDFMHRKEEGPDAGMLHKRRSCLELLVWLSVPAVILFFILRHFDQ